MQRQFICLTQSAAARDLQASVYRPHSTPAGPDTIWYVVSSDGTPVAWLTHHATVVTPPADLTGYAPLTTASFGLLSVYL